MFHFDLHLCKEKKRICTIGNSPPCSSLNHKFCKNSMRTPWKKPRKNTPVNSHKFGIFNINWETVNIYTILMTLLALNQLKLMNGRFGVKLKRRENRQMDR